MYSSILYSFVFLLSPAVGKERCFSGVVGKLRKMKYNIMMGAGLLGHTKHDVEVTPMFLHDFLISVYCSCQGGRKQTLNLTEAVRQRKGLLNTFPTGSPPAIDKGK